MNWFYEFGCTILTMDGIDKFEELLFDVKIDFIEDKYLTPRNADADFTLVSEIMQKDSTNRCYSILVRFPIYNIVYIEKHNLNIAQILQITSAVGLWVYRGAYISLPAIRSELVDRKTINEWLGSMKASNEKEVNMSGEKFNFQINSYFRGSDTPMPLLIQTTKQNNKIVIESLKFTIPFDLAENFYKHLKAQMTQRSIGLKLN